jgi:E3 ubiquitin-protein ligase TRIP12
MLRLLGVLHQINSDWSETLLRRNKLQQLEASAAVTTNVFVNNKLTAKLNRQLEEPMIVASNCLPDWAVEMPRLFPFLFPFETRYTFLQSTAFGYARLMQKWLQSARDAHNANSRRDENLSFLGRLQRQKVRISRQRLLESAMKVFELYGGSKAMLEVEYFDEVGTGLGPTLEFYSLVSKEFRKKSHGLWRGSEISSEESEFVHSAAGLFPSPVEADKLGSDELATKRSMFKTLGMVVAKALMDSRIVDIPFSKMFMKIVLNQHIPLTIASVKVSNVWQTDPCG